MEIYETTIIFKLKFNNTTVNRISKMLQKFTGDDYFITKDCLGTKDLAYEVKGYKQRLLYRVHLAGYKRKH